MSAPISTQLPVTISILPEEILLDIFRNLSPLERSDSAVVSTVWNRLVTDRSLWPKSLDTLKCNVIDEPVFRQHALQLIKTGDLSFEGTRPVAKDDIITLMKVARFYERLQAAGTSIENNRGVTILTIPKGLSINLVRTVFLDRIYYIWDLIFEVLGDAKVEKAYQVIIANDVLKGTLNKSIKEQKTLLGKTKCVLPKILDVMTLAILTEKSTPTRTRLFDDNPRIYTRCIEVIKGPLLKGGIECWSLFGPLLVGYFTVRGLFFPHYNQCYDDNDVGAAGLRGF